VTDRLISTSEGTESGAFVAVDWGLIAFSGMTWGASFLFMAEGLESYEPGAVTLLRVAFGFLTLTLVARNKSAISRDDWPRIALLGFGWMAFPLTLFPIAQGRISSSLAGMINGAVPISVAIVASVLLRRLPGRWQQAGLLTGLAGLVLIGLPSLDDGGNSIIGVLLVITAVISYGIAWNIAVPLQQKYGSLNVLWHVSGLALILTMPYGIWGLSGSSVELVPTLSLIALGAGGTGLAYVAMVTLSGRAGSTRASVTVYLTPPIAIFLGVWVRDESVASIALAGTALVLIGAWLAGRADDRR
jgi:drug/metabolite transporter (DMT)-like permease